jgi:hypothetical protein
LGAHIRSFTGPVAGPGDDMQLESILLAGGQ